MSVWDLEIIKIRNFQHDGVGIKLAIFTALLNSYTLQQCWLNSFDQLSHWFYRLLALDIDKNISTVTECPTWHILVDGKCVCAGTGGAIKCLSDGQVTGNMYDIYWRATSTWGCPYTANSTLRLYHDYITLRTYISKLNEFMCGGRNRTGLFCSQCKDNLTLHQWQCIECSDTDVKKGIVLFLVIGFIPATLFFLQLPGSKKSGLTTAVLIVIQFTLAKVNSTPGIILSYASNYPMHYLAILAISIFEMFNLDFLRYGSYSSILY